MPLAALFNRFLTTATDPNSSGASSTTPEPAPTPGKSTTAPTAAALFPPPSPSSSDDKDCTHDCAACPSYPRTFEKIGIDTDEPLWGNVKAWRSHLIIATGQDDWIRDVDEIEGSVMAGVKRVVDGGVREKVEKLVDVVSGKEDENDKDKEKEKKEKTEKKGKGRIMVSASNMHVDDDEDGATVIMVPGFEVASGVRETDAEWVVRHLEAGPGCDEPLLSSDSSPPESTSTMTMTPAPPPPHIAFRPFPHQTLILLCSHRRRDARCGISAPILRKEFERHLSPRGLWRDLTDWREGGVKVLFVNHVGGHKFAANCIVYQKDGNGEAGRGVWLARVKPGDVKGIVGWVLGERGVEEEMVRGGFDRGRGLVSW